MKPGEKQAQLNLFRCGQCILKAQGRHINSSLGRICAWRQEQVVQADVAPFKLLLTPDCQGALSACPTLLLGADVWRSVCISRVQLPRYTDSSSSGHSKAFNPLSRTFTPVGSGKPRTSSCCSFAPLKFCHQMSDRAIEATLPLSLHGSLALGNCRPPQQAQQQGSSGSLSL